MSWTPFPSVTHVVGQEAIDRYAKLSGDFNPLHTDPEYAAAGPFGTVVAHGPVGLQAIFEALTTWLGTDRMPAGVLVDVAYRGPVRVGDRVTCTASEPDEHAGALTLRATCVNQDGAEILQALIVVPRGLAPRAGAGS
jgi:3-hydroxybutyryl-CoA dehydratase